MSSLAKIENTAVSGMSEQQLMTVLKSSLYPGAKDESIKMVLSYCQAARLDPLQKPVHIVPMSVTVGDKKEMRDVIMPGIGLYRTQAARTGAYAGVSEPVFGPVKKMPIKRKQYNNAGPSDKTFKMVDDGEMEFPEWCKITVRRIVAGVSVDFSAVEYWTENYATAGKDSTAPNSMWARRPYAQLAKCVEAQALRKAFPEVGAEPTADEMEGKYHSDVVEADPYKIEAKLPELTSEQLAKRVADKTDADGVVTFGPRYQIENGEATAEDFIAFLSAKFTLTESIKEQINSWSTK